MERHGAMARVAGLSHSSVSLLKQTPKFRDQTRGVRPDEERGSCSTSEVVGHAIYPVAA